MSGKNLREEAPAWSQKSEGSGVIMDEGIVSNLLRCSPNLSGIIGEDSELLSWQKEVAKSIE